MLFSLPLLVIVNSLLVVHSFTIITTTTSVRSSITNRNHVEVGFGTTRRSSLLEPSYVSTRDNIDFDNDDDTDLEFANFAASLETTTDRSSNTKTPPPKTVTVTSSSTSAGATTTTTSTKSRSSKPAAYQKVQYKTTNKSSTEKQWQIELDQLLLDPTLSVSQRQSLLSNLVVNGNEDIRNSVLTAFRDRNIDPLLTPTQRKIQDGTRAVVRQVTNDILPSIAQTVRNTDSISFNGLSNAIVDTIRSPPSDDITKIGNRIFNAFNTQLQQNIQTLTGDMMNPSRIPQRITQQTEDILKEIQNVFSETPIGLQEPKYSIIYTTDNYEVRDYEGYYVATTNIATTTNNNDSKNTNNYNNDKGIMSITEQGAAFNTLAAYIFGANQQKLVMDMTTPVTMTMTGEMRFYVNVDIPPEPLKQDESYNIYTTTNNQKICIQYIPSALLAVRRFTGFVTDGEISRQKNTLLTSITFDSQYIELDIPHGSTVGHVIFQYNPPYTIPIVRRNEIAVPVVLVQQYDDTNDTINNNDNDTIPSTTTTMPMTSSSVQETTTSTTNSVGSDVVVTNENTIINGASN